NELVVMLKEGETVESFSESVAGKGIKVVGYIPDFNIVQVEVPSEERETLKNELARNPLVKVVSYQTVYGTNAAPNDPALINDNVWDDWGLKAIGAEAAWDVTRGDPNVIIAIVDTGMLIDHEELKGRIVSPKSFYSDDGVQQVGSADDMMHATHVAIIAAGSGNNGLGTSGVAPGCRIMPVQVLYDNGLGELGSTTTTAAGIAYAIRNNARVINLSLGPVLEHRGLLGALVGIFGSLYENYRSPDSRDGAQDELLSMRESDALLYDDIFAKAEDAGVTVVEAAGNDDLPG
ncbi:MAG TPA: S8 family serine peptidase, partial [Candidatus Avalokitesvara rifleensis]|uniref:S8 family serine peptidase n=1 Tax=Candidatus Avalokitesvara rifleensis TaxID=3367620 RepID=UPI004027F04B